MILEQVIVTKESLEDEDPYEIIGANIEFINILFRNYVRRDEICIDSLKSYYVDYYLAQVNNGGFSQFVYNSNWDDLLIDLILEGLGDMGAHRNLSLFKKSAKIVSGMSKRNFERYLDGEYFGNYLQIGHLNKFNDRFFELQKTESLIQFNSSWLKSLPSLKVINSNERDVYIKNLMDKIPDKEERIRASLEYEPRNRKIIRALCKAANQNLEFITDTDLRSLDGKKIVGPNIMDLLLGDKTASAQHFVTNEGHHYMMDLDGKSVMFKFNSEEVVVEIDAIEI